MTWHAQPIADSDRGQLVTITAPDGTELLIQADFGFRVVGWRLPDGLELVAGDLATLATQKPTWSGIPVLFPWPNRISHGRFTWAGQDWELPMNEGGRPNAIHGLAVDGTWAWEVTDSGIAGTYSLVDPRWPGQGALSLTYLMVGTDLHTELQVTNTGAHDLPFGVGFHPYFTALGAASIDDCELWCPGAQHWPAPEGVPTGPPEPVPPELDFQTPRPVGDAALDNAFTALAGTGVRPLARVSGPAGSVEVIGGDEWRDFVIYVSPERTAIALEPYTCPTNAVNMPDPTAVGWRSVAPGETWNSSLTYRFTAH